MMRANFVQKNARFLSYYQLTRRFGFLKIFFSIWSWSRLIAGPDCT